MSQLLACLALSSAPLAPPCSLGNVSVAALYADMQQAVTVNQIVVVSAFSQVLLAYGS